MQFSPASFTLSLFDPDIFVNTLLSNTFSLRTSLTRIKLQQNLQLFELQYLRF
jgi:hypothetical protein